MPPHSSPHAVANQYPGRATMGLSTIGRSQPRPLSLAVTLSRAFPEAAFAKAVIPCVTIPEVVRPEAVLTDAARITPPPEDDASAITAEYPPPQNTVRPWPV